MRPSRKKNENEQATKKKITSIGKRWLDRFLTIPPPPQLYMSHPSITRKIPKEKVSPGLRPEFLKKRRGRERDWDSERENKAEISVERRKEGNEK